MFRDRPIAETASDSAAVLTPEQEKTKRDGIRVISDGYLDYIDKIKDKLPESVLKEVAIEGVLEGISRGRIRYKDNLDKLPLPEDFAVDPRVKEAAIKGIASVINSIDVQYMSGGEEAQLGYVGSALDIKDEFGLTQDDLALAAEKGIANLLSSAKIREALFIKKELKLDQDLFQSPEVIESAQAGFAYVLRKDYGGMGIDPENLVLLNESIKFPEGYVGGAIKKTLIDTLSQGKHRVAVSIKEGLNLDENVLKSPEVIEAARVGFTVLLSRGDLPEANGILADFNLKMGELNSLPEVNEAAKQGYIVAVSHGSIDSTRRALEIRSTYLMDKQESKDFLSSPETIEAMKKGYINRINRGFIEEVELMETLPEWPLVSDDFLRSSEVMESAKKGFTHAISYPGTVKDAAAIAKKFNFAEGYVVPILRDDFKKNLPGGYGLNKVIPIREHFTQYENELNTIIKEGLVNELSDGNMDGFQKIRSKLTVDVTREEILNLRPDLESFLAKINELSPKFYTQTQKSDDVFYSLLGIEDQDQFIETLKQNPNLLKAIEDNSRYGVKLAVKYNQFDATAKEKLEFLFDSEASILAESPNMDSNSQEFRILMQERLKTFNKNQEILEAISQIGVDVKEWLEYKKIADFKLGETKETVRFSEIIASPIERIAESIEFYASKIKLVLERHQAELANLTIPSMDSNEIKERLASLNTQLKDAGDERRAKGLTIEIAKEEKKLSNIKSIPFFSKVADELGIWLGLSKSIETDFNKLKEAEEKIKNSKGKDALAAKKQVEDIKVKIRNYLNVLDQDITLFETNLRARLVPILGEEKYQSMAQEMKTEGGEQLVHYNFDRSTLNNLFEKEAGKAKDKLEGRQMNVAISSRNTKRGLYLGNYTNCCVSIEGPIHGPKSPILDYLTDPSIQIVSITDEEKDIVVASAWCFLGKDQSGNVALVVDNIEANTEYSNRFPKQMTDEMFAFLKDLASRSGVKKVVMGQANNDLPTKEGLEQLPTDGETYSKVGPYNRESEDEIYPDFYYLEAENKEVKIISA